MTAPRITHHFAQRVTERMRGVHPQQLAEGLAWAIANHHDGVRYCGRRIHDGKVSRLFEFDADGQAFCVIASDEATSLVFITVYPREGRA